MWQTTGARIGVTIGRGTGMINRTAVRKKVALVMTNASASKKSAAKVMKRKKKGLRLKPDSHILG